MVRASRTGLFGARLAVGLAVALTVPLTGAAACGYAAGFRAREGVRTIAVPIFENRTGERDDGSRRELELALTRAVVREVQRRTPYRLVSPPRADAVLRGELVRVRETIVVEGRDDQPLLSSGRFVVRVRLEEGGETVRERTFEEQVEFSSGPGTLGTSEELLRAPAEEAFRKVAERIVMVLEG